MGDFLGSMLIFQGAIDQGVYSKVILVASHHFDCVSLPILTSKRFDHPMILGGLLKTCQKPSSQQEYFLIYKSLGFQFQR